MSATAVPGPLCHKCQLPCAGSYIHLDGASFHSRCVFDASLMAEKETLAIRLFNLEQEIGTAQRKERLAIIQRMDCLGPPCGDYEPCPVCAAKEFKLKSE